MRLELEALVRTASEITDSGFRDFLRCQRWLFVGRWDVDNRKLGVKMPAFAHALMPKTSPTRLEDPDVWQVRYDIVDIGGSITLRYAGKLLHLGMARGHARTEVICLVHGYHAPVITHTGDDLGEYTIDTEKDYQNKSPLTRVSAG